ncbi:hypothetical protein [Cumulibacter soli]|uniref:hypothetical protein n=1 Tax=Cumulibacter soli TaxID=2546344 RepID=UPI0010671F92|nr:hypothetical protein [Cumulibacter soli]
MAARHDHGAYGPKYDTPGQQGAIPTSPPTAPGAPTAPGRRGSTEQAGLVAGGSASAPPHTGAENPMASAPHVAAVGARPVRRAPSIAVGLTLFAVLLGALALIWPTKRVRQSIGPDSDMEVVFSFWIHGAASTETPDGTQSALLPVGLILFILVLVCATGGAIVAWIGRSLRCDAFGMLCAGALGAVFAVPSLMAFGDATFSEDSATQEYAAGVWLGIASGVIALAAAALFFIRLGRDVEARIHN